MKKLFSLLDKARHSSFSRTILNLATNRAIPYNRPHGIKIIEVFDEGIKARLPYRRINQNHLRGLHACALATLSEFTAGMTLTHCMRSDAYRLIMKDLNMVYHYQGKTDVMVSCIIPKDRLEKEVYIPLKDQDAVFIEIQIETYDTEKNHICTAKVNWQIKKWDHVKAK
ncbi:MAG TPA: DUF4442 domain-containing protein [Bacteroidia bacterium]|nr:DUF4442 domain-containing protein [Bacteroidia bacterium]HNS12014.1 DUF4442 domain-containing protein [Bacteroidia bacterium]